MFRLLPAAFALLLAITVIRAFVFWTDGGGGRSDAAVMFAFFLIGVPIWLWILDETVPT